MASAVGKSSQSFECCSESQKKKNKEAVSNVMSVYNIVYTLQITNNLKTCDVMVYNILEAEEQRKKADDTLALFLQNSEQNTNQQQIFLQIH